MDIWSLIELERQIKKFKSIKELSEWVSTEIDNEDKKMTKYVKETQNMLKKQEKETRGEING